MISMINFVYIYSAGYLACKVRCTVKISCAGLLANADCQVYQYRQYRCSTCYWREYFLQGIFCGEITAIQLTIALLTKNSTKTCVSPCLTFSLHTSCWPALVALKFNAFVATRGNLRLQTLQIVVLVHVLECTEKHQLDSRPRLPQLLHYSFSK